MIRFSSFLNLFDMKVFSLFTVFNLLYLLSISQITGNNQFNFLVWNLFLGFVPYFVSIVLMLCVNKINTILLLLGSFIWLLFYPNAPYMITDLIHIDKQNTVTLEVYEALMIFSFAMQSLFFGFYSLKLMYFVFNQKFSKKIAQTFIAISVLLSSFGIYLGRIPRFNSWDVFTNPFSTFEKIFSYLFPISQNITTYTIIFLFTIIQLLLLSMIRDFDEDTQ